LLTNSPHLHPAPSQGKIILSEKLGLSNSDIIIPLKKRNSSLYGILDVDSSKFNAFSETDREWLKKIVSFI